MRRRRRYYIPYGCILVPVVLVGLLVAIFWGLPLAALRKYGPYSDTLNPLQRVQYSALLLWYDGLITSPVDPTGAEQSFSVQAGDSAASVASRLEAQHLIRSAGAFRAYLVYTGMDIGIQAGNFTLSPALSGIQIAQRLQDATPTQVKFTVLAGWRMEEIAASLPTSGLDASPDAFLAVARNPQAGLDFLPATASAEGFLLPGEYTLPRAIQTDQLVTFLLRNFALALTPDLRNGFSRQGLTVYQAVTLASIVQREAVVSDEQPIIASVFLNRIKASMPLEADPTVQYALGLGTAGKTWWPSPLTADDLQVDSPYNTYRHNGLPPGPIDNPSLGALQAVAYPAQTPYYYFRARCDGSGLHNFSETFEQHLEKACP